MQNLKTSNDSRLTIRLDFILLILEVLKLQGLVDISWGTLLLLMVVPMAIGRLFMYWAKNKLKQIQEGK